MHCSAVLLCFRVYRRPIIRFNVFFQTLAHISMRWFGTPKLVNSPSQFVSALLPVIPPPGRFISLLTQEGRTINCYFDPYAFFPHSCSQSSSSVLFSPVQ